MTVKKKKKHDLNNSTIEALTLGLPGDIWVAADHITCELVGWDKRGGVAGPASDVVTGKAVTRDEASLPLSPS